ncbi:MAG: hypothetical protein ABI718_17655 [Acidobacteriota bacterium]
MTDFDSDGRTLVFDRTPIARILSCAAICAAGALFFDYLSLGSRVHFLPLTGLFLLLAGTVLSALLQYGDHIYVGPKGLLYENRWLSMFGSGTRWIGWDDIVEVREVRRKILILLSSDGRRVLVDAIVGYAIARREILRRVPHAVISGTLTRGDRS